MIFGGLSIELSAGLSDPFTGPIYGHPKKLIIGHEVFLIHTIVMLPVVIARFGDKHRSHEK